MLPRSGLSGGLTGDTRSLQPAYQPSFLGIVGNNRSQVPPNVHSGAVSLNGSHQSSTSMTAMSGLPMLLHDMRSESGLVLEHAVRQSFQSIVGRDTAFSQTLSPRRVRKPSKPSKRPIRKSLIGGPTSSAANTIPLKRRRLPEKPPVVSKEAALPLLTKQGILSRLSIYKEKVHRVAGKHPVQRHPSASSRLMLTIFGPVLCDYLSIKYPEYIVVDENQDGARFAAQFPASEVFLSRAGRVGLTDFVDGTASLYGSARGREICAGNVEIFLLEQVENGTFELQEDGNTHSIISTATENGEVTERVKRLRADGNTTCFPKSANGYVSESMATSQALDTPEASKEPSSLTAVGLRVSNQAAWPTIMPEPVEQHSQIPLVDRKENCLITIKSEPIEGQIDLYHATCENVGPANVRQESMYPLAKQDGAADRGAIGRANAANLEAAAAVKSRMLKDARNSTPAYIKQDVGFLEISN